MATKLRGLARKVLRLRAFAKIRKILRPQASIPEKGADFSLMDAPAKVRYKMAHDRRPILTTFADKVAVREYVEKKIGARFLTKLYLVTENVSEIDLSLLPREFAFKPSHGSGAGIFVHESADPANSLPKRVKAITWKDKYHIHPDNVDVEQLRKIGKHWLKLRYQNNNDWYEWVYETIRPKLIVEEYLSTADGNPPVNYLIYTYHGIPGYIVVWNVFTSYIALVSPEWEHLDVKSKKWPLASRENMPPKPSNLEEILRVAHELSGGIDFVRVDLYSEEGRITFSEMTNYPGGGRSPAYSAEFDMSASKYWKSFDGY